MRARRAATGRCRSTRSRSRGGRGFRRGARGGAAGHRALLAEISRAHGLDLAAMVFYRAVLDSPIHGVLARRLDAVTLPSELPPAARSAPKLLVVPAFFHRERPDLGGDGRLIVEIARACGLDAAVVPVGSRATAAANAAVVWEAIEREPSPAVWLLSLSKGGPEVRLALEDQRRAPGARHVRGWVNVSGIVRGSHVVDHGSPLRRGGCGRARSPARSASRSRRPGAVDHQPRWRRPLAAAGAHRRQPGRRAARQPRPARARAALSPARRARPERRLGAAARPGGPARLVYPVWGADHLFRSPQVSPLLYRLFGAPAAEGCAGSSPSAEV